MYVCVCMCVYSYVCIGICVVEKRGNEKESEEAMLLKEREFGRSIGRICIKDVSIYIYKNI